VARQLHHSDRALDGQDLADAYHAMDVFAFASHSETQGMVLAEAMTAGVPVVAVDAPGVREVVADGVNGRLLNSDDEEEFAAALRWCAERSPKSRHRLIDGALRAAESFTMERCATRVLDIYQQLLTSHSKRASRDETELAAVVRLIGEEWKILAGKTSAVGDALFGTENGRDATA
jgi:hypothetical protein